MSYDPLRRVTAVAAAAIFVGVLFGFAAPEPAAAEWPLRGTVVDADGQALAEMQVRLFDLDAAAFTAEHALAQATTDAQGRFTIAAAERGKKLLKVIGAEGAGRVVVTVADDAEPVSVTYPVRTKIWLLHDNDLHFDFNHLGPFRDVVNRYRNQYENVFLLNAGDIFVRRAERWEEPEPEHYFRRAAGMILLMNTIRYDVATAGNHEIHYHGDFTRKALELAEFPILAANIDVETDKLPQFEDYVVLHTDNRYSLAILGISTGADAAEGVTQRPFVETAREHLFLRERHDLFIALTHIGVTNDRRLAEAVPELDVIVGGHSHTLLREAELVNGVLVAQAGGSPHPVDPTRPKYLGKIRLVLENGRLVEKKGHVRIFGE